MMHKTIVFLCIQAFVAHTIYAQCIGNGINPGLNYGLAANAYGLAGIGLGLAGPSIGFGNGLGCNGLTSAGVNTAVSNGGGFTVTSSSPIAPSGVSVVSEYVIEGPLNVGGQLPLLGAVALEGKLPTGGAAGTAYSCGNGNVGIISENGAAGNALGAVAFNGLGGAGIGNGLGSGLGLGRLGGSGCALY